MDSIVCSFFTLAPIPASVKTPRFPISWFPATVQNLTCLTPTVTNWLSESGRNSARNTRWLWALVVARLAPNNIIHIVQMDKNIINWKTIKQNIILEKNDKCILMKIMRFLPSCHLHAVTLLSSPTVTTYFPVHEKSTAQTPLECSPLRMDSVSLVAAFQIWTLGGFPIWPVATMFLNLGCWLTARQMMSSVCFR